MTKENAKDYLPLVQALAEGKTIQFCSNSSSSWGDMDELKFASPPSQYRIKPEPRKPKEIWVSDCGGKSIKFREVIEE